MFVILLIDLILFINVILLSGFYYSSSLQENNKEIHLLVAIRSVIKD